MGRRVSGGAKGNPHAVATRERVQSASSDSPRVNNSGSVSTVRASVDPPRAGVWEMRFGGVHVRGVQVVTRRTFLRVFGTVTVAVGVVPVIGPLESLTTIPPVASRWSLLGSCQPLTYGMLESAYQACVLGENAPTMGMISSSAARALGLVYDMELA